VAREPVCPRDARAPGGPVRQQWDVRHISERTGRVRERGRAGSRDRTRCAHPDRTIR